MYSILFFFNISSNSSAFSDGTFIAPLTNLLPFRISIRAKEFADTLVKYAHLAEQNDGKLNIDIKKSSKGSLFAEINTWKKEKEVTSSEHSPDRQEVDLPF